MAAISDTPELKPLTRRSDTPNTAMGMTPGADSWRTFKRAQRFRSDKRRIKQQDIDLENASVMDLLIFCVAVEMEADELSESGDRDQC